MKYREEGEKSIPLFETETFKGVVLATTGLAQMMVVADTNVAPTVVSPKRHARSFENSKFAPVIVTEVEPEEGPTCGEIRERVAGAENLKLVGESR